MSDSFQEGQQGLKKKAKRGLGSAEGVSVNGGEAMKAIQEWEDAWSHYILKLDRLEYLKSIGRYGYQLRQPRKAVQMAAERLRQLDPDFCNRIGIY
jgi:hypothetical protein